MYALLWMNGHGRPYLCARLVALFGDISSSAHFQIFDGCKNWIFGALQKADFQAAPRCFDVRTKTGE